MITYRLPTQIGDIDIEIADNLNNVILSGIGKATITYSQFIPHDIRINNIETSCYDKETNLNIITLIKNKGIDIKTDTRRDQMGFERTGHIVMTYNEYTGENEENINGFTFAVPEDLKLIISEKFNSLYDKFTQAIINGKINIFYGNYLYVEDTDYEGYKSQTLFSYLMRSVLNLLYPNDWDISYSRRWTKDQNITKDVVPVIKWKLEEIEKVRKAKEEHKQKLFANVASHNLTKPRRFNDDADYEIIVSITMKSGTTYKFSARNIEDVGLVINPTWRGGGIIYNLDEFQKNNPSASSWLEECRKITSSGYILNKMKEGIEDISVEEAQAYEAARYLTHGYTEVRT